MPRCPTSPRPACLPARGRAGATWPGGYRLRRFACRTAGCARPRPGLAMPRVHLRTGLADGGAPAGCDIDLFPKFLVSVSPHRTRTSTPDLTHELTARDVLDAGAARTRASWPIIRRSRAPYGHRSHRLRHMTRTLKGCPFAQAAYIHLAPARVSRFVPRAACADAMRWQTASFREAAEPPRAHRGPGRTPDLARLAACRECLDGAFAGVNLRPSRRGRARGDNDIAITALAESEATVRLGRRNLCSS